MIFWTMLNLLSSLFFVISLFFFIKFGKESKDRDISPSIVNYLDGF